MDEGIAISVVFIRMRFVNATVAMQKWKERIDRLEELKAENPNATLYSSLICFYS